MEIKYKHIRYEDRIAIGQLLRAGVSKAKIAKQLGFHRATIYRELKRNGRSFGYCPSIIEQSLQERRKRQYKLNSNPELREYVFNKLKIGWSPEQIAGRLKLVNGNGKLALISHETIYAYIYSDHGIRNKWYKCLRQHRSFRYPKFSRKHRMGIPNRVSIQERPEEINNRRNYGHWEGDLMVFKQGIKTNLITIRERKSRYFIAIKNANRKAKSTAELIISNLNKIKELVKSITFDNGLEFCCHEDIAKALNAKTYFCDPYKSYQKGSVENGNRILRQYFPRTIEINDIAEKEIKKAVRRINQRPMKCLGYQTPQEVFYGQRKLASDK